MADDRTLARWRLVLGRFSHPRLGGPGAGAETRMEATLDYLYGREYAGRGTREASRLTLPDWVGEVRKLFPKRTVEVLERHALDRYRMTELLTDPVTLSQMQPSYDLLKALLAFRHRLSGPAIPLARSLVRQCIDELTRRLARHVRRVLWGRRSRRRLRQRTPRLDFLRTLRENLRHFDPKRRRLALLERLAFLARAHRHFPWHVIMAVDCSGSMLDSVIHSAVMAGILAGLPAVRVSLVAFDTALVDLTPHASDAVEVLMNVQLGGGTDIGGAVCYCERLVEQPARTVLVVVTDFCEGSHPKVLLSAIRRLREAGVRVLGLAALDREANPVYDRKLASRCVDAGAEVAALTPEGLADWLAGVLG
ncbi:MAG: VWA domain-containing protein [Candidatus Eremiobacterota bacterium]